MSVTLSIIIVNWNGIKFLPNCLKSIVENPPRVSYEIILVDNDSSDESVEWLKSSQANEMLKNINFTLVESKENLGFGKANNLAFERTAAPFLFLLNPDTMVKENAIDKLLTTFNLNEKIGAVAPKLLNEDGSIQASVWGFPPTPLVFLVEGFKLSRFLPKKLLENWLYSSYWDYSRRSSVPIFSGAAIMAKREMINEVGGFDPSFHMYGEDTEWCVRIKRSGWDLYFEPEAEVFHVGGQSALQRWGEMETRLKEEKASIAFQIKCLPSYLVFFNALTKAFIFSIYLIKRFFLRQDYSHLQALLNLQLKGCRAVLSNSPETFIDES